MLTPTPFDVVVTLAVFSALSFLAGRCVLLVRRTPKQPIITARVIADSVHEDTCSRLTTFLIVYPKFIHGDFMTHRVFARNASSSRAEPSEKRREAIRKHMAIPVAWGENKPGMQAGAELPPFVAAVCRTIWILTGHVALLASAALDKLRVHKQVVNRIVEPWSHITVVVTSTDEGYANFYALRDHEDADPTIQVLARRMLEAHADSVPRTLKFGQMHLPFVTDEERETLPLINQIQISIARCARTSYNTFDGVRSLAKDIALVCRLLDAKPMHASPTEHQAEVSLPGKNGGCFGDHTGWKQYRKTLIGESFRKLDVILEAFRNRKAAP